MIFTNPPKLFIFLFFIILNYSKEEEDLRWAFEIFRHGARTPYSGMTEDPSGFIDCFGVPWIGIKELTGVGLRQHFLVGYRNRIRYMIDNKLLKETYDPREVYLISTDSNRTIMSANAQVQGLYIPGTALNLNEKQAKVAIPPVEEGIFDDEQKILDDNGYLTLPNGMNIMPIHTFFNQDHFIQLQDKKVCPKSKDIYTKNQNRKEVIEFLDKMTQKYGQKLSNILYKKEDQKSDVLKNYTKAYYIFDTIISQYTEGIDYFDSLCEKLNVDKFELLNDSFTFFELDLIGNGIDNDKELCLHSMSPIFDRLLKWMDAKINKDIEGKEDYTEYDLPKFVMFSAHDSTCGAFMGFMKEVFGTEIKYPFFATNINLELVRDGGKKKENYKVRYIINDDYMKDINYIDFEKKLKEKMKSTDDINKFCGFVEENKNEKKEEEEETNITVYIIVNVVLSVISIILIILIFITIKKKKSNRTSEIDNMDNIEPLNPVKGSENE